MPPKKTKESLILVINIGITSPNAENNVLEKEKLIAKRKIEKMIFLSPKDEVAIILMGSCITKNSLNTEHVEEFTDFQVPNWDLIEKLIALESTKHCSNWVEALEDAVEFMKQNVIDASMKKIILISDFNEEEEIISQFQADVIAERLSTEKIELITIGEKSLDDRSAAYLKSEILLKAVHKKINGQHITFDNAISSLKVYTQASTKPCPSYFTLELADKKIPIASYVKINEEKFPVWKKAKDNQKLEVKKEYFDRQRTSYKEDEVIKGYKYGGTFISVEKGLEETMSYKSGERSYRIHSFTDRNNIDLDYFYKSPSHVILPSSGVQSVSKPFYALVQALHVTNSVAIARKVYKTNSAPRMVALFPCIDIPDEPWCLVEIELAFAEDHRIMGTTSMKSVIKQLSSEQNEAIDSLIDSLVLSDSEDSYEVDGSQYFLPGYVLNPAIQHRWHMLSYRAINPDKPLLSMEGYLKEILEVPLIKERSKCHLQKIAQLFRLQNTETKSRQKDEKKNLEEENIVIDNIDTKQSSKIADKVDTENKSYKEESALFMDTIDVDLDELATNI